MSRGQESSQAKSVIVEFTFFFPAVGRGLPLSLSVCVCYFLDLSISLISLCYFLAHSRVFFP